MIYGQVTETGEIVTAFENVDLVDGLYTVAMEPERFRELADIWSDYLKKVDSQSTSTLETDFNKLESHLLRAEAIFDMVESNTAILPPRLLEKINHDPQVILAIDKTGVFEAVNNAGQALLGVKKGDTLENLNFPRETIDMISFAVKSRFASSVDHVEGMPSLQRLIREKEDAPLLISLTDWMNSDGSRLVLLKTVDFIWPDYLTPIITEAFGLTDAEADIIKLIVEGKSVQDVAKARESKLTTVRAQIRAIYAKTATRNQSEFIRMAIGLTTMQMMERESYRSFANRVDGGTPLAYPRFEHEHTMTLPDGRILDYAVFGAPNGKPCLFFHSELLGNIWPAKIVDYATVKGLRIIVPARPFYGRSDGYPKNVDYPTQTAIDFIALLDHLNIRRALLIGQTLGGMYALALTRDFPDRVAGMVMITPMLPHLKTEHNTGMPKLHRFISDVVRRQPRLLNFIARAGSGYYRRVGPIRFLRHVFGDLECDVDIINDPVNQEALIRTLQFGSAHGHKGYVAGYSHMIFDAVDLMKPLPFPIYGIIGDKDKNTRFDRAKSLQDIGVNFNIVIAKGGGELLIYSHPYLVVDTMLISWKVATSD